MSVTDEPTLDPRTAMKHLIAGCKIADALWTGQDDARVQFDGGSHFFRFWEHVGFPGLFVYRDDLFKVWRGSGPTGSCCYVKRVFPYGLVDKP